MSKKVKVKVKFNGVEYRGSIVKMGLPGYMIGITKEINWISNGEYAVVHRIAACKIDGINSVGKEILKEVEKICLLRNIKNIKNIKIDTHEDNIVM